jgi:hypothetical protein
MLSEKTRCLSSGHASDRALIQFQHIIPQENWQGAILLNKLLKKLRKMPKNGKASALRRPPLRPHDELRPPRREDRQQAVS